jgi:hypothetical protein
LNSLNAVKLPLKRNSTHKSILTLLHIGADVYEKNKDVIMTELCSAGGVVVEHNFKTKNWKNKTESYCIFNRELFNKMCFDALQAA